MIPRIISFLGMVHNKSSCCAVSIAGIALFYFSCVGSPPMIVDVRYAVAESFNKNTEFVTEQLNIFVKVVEEDGFDDIDALYVIGDENMVYWALDSQSWSVVEDENSIWVGSDSLVNTDSLFIDGGTYRVEVYDKAGEKDQYVIELDNQRLSSGGNFSSSLHYNPIDDLLSIDSEFQRSDVQFIVDDESYIATLDNQTSISISDLSLERSLPEYRSNLLLYLFLYNGNIPQSYIVLGPLTYDDILKVDAEDENT